MIRGIYAYPFVWLTAARVRALGAASIGYNDWELGEESMGYLVRFGDGICRVCRRGHGVRGGSWALVDAESVRDQVDIIKRRLCTENGSGRMSAGREQDWSSHCSDLFGRCRVLPGSKVRGTQTVRSWPCTHEKSITILSASWRNICTTTTSALVLYTTNIALNLTTARPSFFCPYEEIPKRVARVLQYEMQFNKLTRA